MKKLLYAILACSVVGLFAYGVSTKKQTDATELSVEQKTNTPESTAMVQMAAPVQEQTEQTTPTASNQNYSTDNVDWDNYSHNYNAIKVALILDTSGSMSGLIEQAKSQLWQILNQLAATEKEGMETKLQVALYEYGNSNSSKNLKVTKLSDFTNDMDAISEQLFKLTTSGGEEYCGAAIHVSLNQLDWGTAEDDDLKMIFIAGNEPFNQGPIKFENACRKAKSNAVIVNTIFCGDYENGRQTFWEDGAVITNGEYMNIDHSLATAYIETPYDKEMDILNVRLNGTYIPYGKKGKAKAANQKKQDLNAVKYSLSYSSDRAAFKASKKYRAEDWDLVDAYALNKNILKKADVIDEELKQLSAEELKAKVEATAIERNEIKAEIKKLDAQRQEYISKNPGKYKKDKYLGTNIQKSIAIQAKRKGFKIR